MTTVKSATLALAAALCAATLAGAAQARGPSFAGGEPGGHVGSMGHMGHMGHMGPGHMGHSHMGHGHMGSTHHVAHGIDGHHHHHHHGFFPVYGFGIDDGYYDDGYYDYGYYDDGPYEDCYRVYRHHRWRVVCDD